MQQFLSLLAIVCLTLTLSCDPPEDDIQINPNCEIIANQILDLIDENQPDRTRINWSGMFNDGPGLPQFDGCFLEYNDRFFSLEQIISFEIAGSRLILYFP